MSLKAFHIIFILASITLSAYYTYWAFGENSRTPGTTTLCMGIAALVITGLLIYYLIRVIDKLRKL